MPIPGGSQLKVLAFADDLVVFCKYGCDQAAVIFEKAQNRGLAMNSSCESQSKYAVEELKVLVVENAVV